MSGGASRNGRRSRSGAASRSDRSSAWAARCSCPFPSSWEASSRQPLTRVGNGVVRSLRVVSGVPTSTPFASRASASTKADAGPASPSSCFAMSSARAGCPFTMSRAASSTRSVSSNHAGSSASRRTASASTESAPSMSPRARERRELTRVSIAVGSGSLSMDSRRTQRVTSGHRQVVLLGATQARATSGAAVHQVRGIPHRPAVRRLVQPSDSALRR